MSDAELDYTIPFTFVKYSFYVSQSSNSVVFNLYTSLYFSFSPPFSDDGLFSLLIVFSHWTATEN